MKTWALHIVFLLLASTSSAQLTIEHSVFFDLDQYELRDESIKSLDSLFENLLYKNVLEVRILGYCDDRGTIDYNQQLSTNRVVAVTKWLQYHHINLNYIFQHIEGLGEIALVDSGIPEEVARTRARNRRVDIQFLLPKVVANRLEIKKIKRSDLTADELAVIDEYEKKVARRVRKNINSQQMITIADTDMYLNIPTNIKPPVNKDYKEPFKSLLRKDIEVGEVIQLENIHFLKGRSTINPGSIPLLRRVIEILVARPDIHFEIRGHVCCINPRFPDALNRNTMRSDLSSARAELIFRLLNENGVASKRMSHKGYGRSRPLGGSDRDDRRVELYITKIDH
ncbi:OmpA family protein [Nonlabens ponticola]|uniref:OmpA family protein n=1 Tax=Nonlabens ponticola TaxID=2496866 RepID=A0A3S9MVI6_9FLAO|nr:OmpA family protein [Nonlabens ponticola]AZQ43162.1 OmpA family protein [Nonlabens ponticola]